jgi:hypothetical protein
MLLMGEVNVMIIPHGLKFRALKVKRKSILPAKQ